MHEEQAFIDAIVADPDDDTVRLVFADWLEEQDDDETTARATLIRVQCEIETRRPWDRRRKELEQQAKTILKSYLSRWTKPLSKLKLGKGWHYRRGFLEAGTFSATPFAERGSEIFSQFPLFRAARLRDASNEVEEVLSSGLLNRLTELDLHHLCGCGMCPIDMELQELFQHDSVRNLRVLRLSDDRIDDELIGKFAESDQFGQLDSLDLSENRIGPEGVTTMVNAPHLNRLVELDLSQNPLGSAGLRALLEGPPMTNLKRLSLRATGLDGPAASELLKSSLMTNLTALELSGNSLGDPFGEELLATSAADALTHLDVRKVDFRTELKRALRERFGERVWL